MEPTLVISLLIALPLIGVWFWLKKQHSKKTPMAKPATQTPASPTAGHQPAQAAVSESQNTSAEVIHLSNYTQTPDTEMSTVTEQPMPSAYVLSPDDAESLASPSAAETTFNSPTLDSLASAASSHPSGVIGMIPEDSTLRRHFICQLKAEFDSQFEPKPTDSTLKRHYETEINSKFERYLTEHR